MLAAEQAADTLCAGLLPFHLGVHPRVGSKSLITAFSGGNQPFSFCNVDIKMPFLELEELYVIILYVCMCVQLLSFITQQGLLVMLLFCFLNFIEVQLMKMKYIFKIVC